MNARARISIWEHKNPHKNTIKIIIKPTYLLLVYIHKYHSFVSFSLAQSHSIARAFIQQRRLHQLTRSIHMWVCECCVVPRIFNAIIISFVRNLNRPHGPFNIYIHTHNGLLYVYFCVSLSFAVGQHCWIAFAWSPFYHFNFFTILIANNDLKNKKTTINTTLIWHLWSV